MQKRLVFTNCMACALSANHQLILQHEVEKRYLTGVYTSAELNKFLKLNGRIIHIFEYWLFASSPDLYGAYVRKIAST